jgi:hypothetical protein
MPKTLSASCRSSAREVSRERGAFMAEATADNAETRDEEQDGTLTPGLTRGTSCPRSRRRMALGYILLHSRMRSTLARRRRVCAGNTLPRHH